MEPSTPRRGTVIFARWGDSAHEPPHSVSAFSLAVRLGATGLAARVWLTADGVPVFDETGRTRVGLRRRAIGDLNFDDLPGGRASLSDLLALSSAAELSLEVATAPALAACMAEIRDVEATTGSSYVERLWVSHTDIGVLSAWRAAEPHLRLVHRTEVSALAGGGERHAADLAHLGIDGVNLAHNDWNGGRMALYRRFDLMCLARGLVHERNCEEMARLHLDGIYSAHVDRVVSALGYGSAGAAGPPELLQERDIAEVPDA
jgi:glycerophosphoryl diester phosphodiesterase